MDIPRPCVGEKCLFYKRAIFKFAQHLRIYLEKFDFQKVLNGNKLILIKMEMN